MSFKVGDRVVDLEILEAGVLIVKEIVTDSDGYKFVKLGNNSHSGYHTEMDDKALISEEVHNSPLFNAMKEEE